MMSDTTFDRLQQLSRDESRVAMATLIATRGTTPKKEGAKMWVGAGGRILGSVTIGGCVDARVIQEAEETLSAGRPRRFVISLGDEEAWDLGLTCSGTVEVLIEPIDLADPDSPAMKAYDVAAAEARAGRHAVTVTPLAEPSARLVVRQDGTYRGSLGNKALDEEAVARAGELIQQRASRMLTIGDSAGETEAFFEVHAPPTSLFVFGAGAVAIPLVQLAAVLGLRTVLVDGRPRFANRERFPAADELHVGIPSEIAESLPFNPTSLVVLVAHDYKYDIPVLKAVLQRGVAYIGLLGSRRRGKAILDYLAEDGIPPEQLQQIRVPVGLDIGAQTAAEIALSILAEAVAVKAGRPGTPMRDRAAV
jgi:xanthine dehydrogenase accessory factor